MKRSVVVILVLSFLVQPVMGEYVDIILSYPENVEKGEEIEITFEIINQSNDMLWDGTILIEESFMNNYKPYIQSNRDYQTNPLKFSTVEPGESFKETFVLTFNRDIPLNEARFNVVLKCGKGPCRGGCRPFYMEKLVYIELLEKRAEAVLKLDVNEFTSYKGETLEIPFTLENIGKIQMRNIKVEIKGDIVSDGIVNIANLDPGIKISDRISISIDENNSKTSFNPIFIARFQEPSGKEGMVYENIVITVIEKQEAQETNASEVNNEINEESTPHTPILLYFFLFLSIIAIIAVILFLIRLFKR
ncbi:MAG TPA: hypothetical protein PKH80_01560 [Methanofastidiosum sp.]|nr:hypothetical protein [Methanofastidiosum sp.]HNU60577.1 hypothetical protein [Methanofastidiosum sp.]